MIQTLHLVVVVISALLMSACSGVNFTDSSSLGSNATSESLKTIQPALAVRGIACLMCHADIRSNVITDFGYGDSFFMGGSFPFDADNNAAYESWYNNVASTWQNADQIIGNVFVPNAQITASVQSLLGVGPLSLQQAMNVAYTPQWSDDGNLTPREMAIRVQPPSGGDRIVAKSKVVIRAPQESEIQALAPQLFASGTGFVRVGGSAPVQFVVRDLGHGSFVMNDESQVLDCANSDIVVNGPLYLRGLKVNAAGGCRLYVTGTVFLEDAVTYAGNGANPNLQITSSRGISMGINYSRLYNRMKVDVRNIQLSSNTPPFATLADDIMADADAVQTLRDAEDDYSGGRASVNYSGLLLNAPVVHSRYLGNVKGTIVAETALFALEQFHFEFDPVFTQTNVLPLLKKAILDVK